VLDDGDLQVILARLRQVTRLRRAGEETNPEGAAPALIDGIVVTDRSLSPRTDADEVIYDPDGFAYKGE
jgi:hypothetical protein